MLPVADSDPDNQPGPTSEGIARLAGFAASLADSAGQPWAGREFQRNAFDDDDGLAPTPLLDALAQFREGRSGPEAVVDALRDCRVLVPLVAEAGAQHGAHTGLNADASQELSLVTVAGPDGRTLLPIFSSVDAMSVWNSHARPVPVNAERAALAAVSDGTDLLILDPTSPNTEFAVRRPALWALAQGISWVPSDRDPSVLHAFRETVVDAHDVQALSLAPGDPSSRLLSEELLVRLRLAPGLSAQRVRELLAVLTQRWSANDTIATRVDSLRLEVDG